MYLLPFACKAYVCFVYIHTLLLIGETIAYKNCRLHGSHKILFFTRKKNLYKCRFGPSVFSQSVSHSLCFSTFFLKPPHVPFFFKSLQISFSRFPISEKKYYAHRKKCYIDIVFANKTAQDVPSLPSPSSSHHLMMDSAPRRKKKLPQNIFCRHTKKYFLHAYFQFVQISSAHRSTHSHTRAHNRKKPQQEKYKIATWWLKKWASLFVFCAHSTIFFGMDLVKSIRYLVSQKRTLFNQNNNGYQTHAKKIRAFPALFFLWA